MPVSEDSSAGQTETPLQQHCLAGLNGLYYIPDYLDSTQQCRLLENIRSSKSRWTQVIKQVPTGPECVCTQCLRIVQQGCCLQVSGRKLQSYGGTVHEKWGGLLQAPLPAWLKPLVTKLDHDFQLYQGPPNHVLLNVYEPGHGILVRVNTTVLAQPWY